MDPQAKKFILENAANKKPEEIAGILGLKTRHVRREIERQGHKQKSSGAEDEFYGFILPKPKYLLLVFFVFAVLAGVSYSNTLQASFHFDDNYSIRTNQALHDLFNLPAIWKWDPSRFLPNLTFAFNYQLGGVNVTGYHILNILIHIMTGFLVYLFVLALFQTPRLKNLPLLKRSKEVALFAGLLFICHPIQIQAVTYIVQRHAAFATLFYVITCFLYVCSRLKRSEKLYWIAVLFCVASMFTKPITFTLPAAILMCEFFLFPSASGRSITNRLAKLLPFFITMAIIPLLRYQSIRGHQADQFVETASIAPLHYLFTQFNVIVEYLRFLFWPSGQSIYHSFPISFTLMEHKTLLCLFFLMGLLGGALILRKRQPAVAFGIFWFFLTLAVESSIIPIEHVIFEHRMYLPMVGVCLALSTILVLSIKNQKVLGAVVLMIVAILCFVTYQRNEVWKTDESLWKDAAKKYKGMSNQKMVYDESLGGVVQERVEDKPFAQWRHEAQ